MKFIILFGLVAVVAAGYHAPVVYLNTGASNQYRTQDNHGNYAFGYDEGHATGGSFRKESGDGYGRVTGSYGLRDRDGRQRTVYYVADEHGFRANIVTNEPGTASSAPADTTVNGVGPVAPIVKAVAVAPVAAYHAPIAVAPASLLASHSHRAPAYGAYRGYGYNAPVYRDYQRTRPREPYY